MMSIVIGKSKNHKSEKLLQYCKFMYDMPPSHWWRRGGRPSPGAPCSEKKSDESELLDAPMIDKNMI